MQTLILSNNNLNGPRFKTVHLFLQESIVTKFLLNHCQLDYQDAAALSFGLAKNSKLKHFEISENIIKDAGAISIAEAFQGAVPQLEILKMRRCMIGD